MSRNSLSIDAAPARETPPSLPARPARKWLEFLRSPLWLCLLLGLLIRVWLVVHTHGVIAGDEAVVGIQAEHILHGDRPIYYYGQSYMGSLEAYLLALLFAIIGPSSWAMRAIPGLISLALIYFTWKLAAALGDAAHLSPTAKRRFMFIAALVAALPPLYDAVMELRAMEGYIETCALACWMLLCALRLILRWQADASWRELALRWAGLGFLIGLGMWIDPLIVSGILASALWLAGYCLLQVVKLLRHAGAERQATWATFFKGLLTAIAVVPGALVGFAPAIDWGATHHWANITYLFLNGGSLSRSRLHTIHLIANIYARCLAPRIIGGALPTESYVTPNHPHILTFGLIISAICIFVAAAGIALSFFWRHPVVLQVRALTALPLLFGACTAFTFCISKISEGAIYAGCGPLDGVGRYAAPLLVALPFFIATTFIVAGLALARLFGTARGTAADMQLEEHAQAATRSASPVSLVRSRLAFLAQGVLIAVLVLYLCLQSYAYVVADSGYTFQTSGCVIAPANNDPIIAYMQQQRIHYAWAIGWIGDPITFKTDGSIIVAGPQLTADHQPALGRLPNNMRAVMHADRASYLFLAYHSDPHPPILRFFDGLHITYKAARFYSEPGYDLLVVTPLNRTILPYALGPHGYYIPGAFGVLYYTCI